MIDIDAVHRRVNELADADELIKLHGIRATEAALIGYSIRALVEAVNAELAAPLPVMVSPTNVTPAQIAALKSAQSVGRLVMHDDTSLRTERDALRAQVTSLMGENTVQQGRLVQLNADSASVREHMALRLEQLNAESAQLSAENDKLRKDLRLLDHNMGDRSEAAGKRIAELETERDLARDAYAALMHRHVTSIPIDEAAWLIERDAPIRWWTGTGWSSDSLAAVRFSRQVDGERVASQLNMGGIVTEHVWQTPRPARPPVTPERDLKSAPMTYAEFAVHINSATGHDLDRDARVCFGIERLDDTDMALRTRMLAAFRARFP